MPSEEKRAKKAAYDKLYVATNRDSRRAYARAYAASHKEKRNSYIKIYQAKNKDSIRVRMQKYYLKNRDSILKRTGEYSKNNRAKISVTAAARDKERRATDINFKLKKSLRCRVRAALKGINKSARTLVLLGCTIEFLREHLENQFQPGMTWENYGPVWHVDHIVPCAEFHLQHSEEQEICFHWTNLQPLFAQDNLQKSAKVLL